MGLVWLTAVFLFLTCGILYSINFKYAWLPGLVAVIISQILVIMFWTDAKFGTLPNILILVVSLASLGHYNFQKLVRQETDYLLNQNVNTENKILSENDINELSEPVKNWFRHSGAKAIRQAEHSISIPMATLQSFRPCAIKTMKPMRKDTSGQ